MATNWNGFSVSCTQSRQSRTCKSHFHKICEILLNGICFALRKTCCRSQRLRKTSCYFWMNIGQRPLLQRSMNWVMSEWPEKAAMCRVLQPSLLVLLGSAPCRTINCTNASWPERQACWRGVWPSELNPFMSIRSELAKRRLCSCW